LRVLPELIINSERAVHELERSRAACRQASEVYQLARAVLKYLGRVDLCGLVSDRAMRYAEETEDPLLIAAATWSLGHALLTDDMPGGALDLAIKGSEALEPFVLWVPELGGRFEERNPSHKMLMSVLGGMSESERQHVQARVRAAMDAQVVNEGRHQGGRAPYGYVVVGRWTPPQPS
jgi:hypothetical protein